MITAALSQVKSPHLHVGGSPNRMTQSLIAVLAGLQVPFLCTETHELGEEMSPRTSTRFTCIIGWKPTTMADS